MAGHFVKKDLTNKQFRVSVFVATFPQMTAGQFFVPFDDGMPAFATPIHQANMLSDDQIDFDVIDQASDIGAIHLGQTKDGVLIHGTEAQAWALYQSFNPEAPVVQAAMVAPAKPKVADFCRTDFTRAGRVSTPSFGPAFSPRPDGMRLAA